jgi:hypothetical protein
VNYAVQGLLDGLKEQIERVWEQQYDVSWTDYVASFFANDHSASASRRKHLIQDLSDATKPLTLNQIASLSPRIVKDYSSKSVRTLKRDVDILMKDGLVVMENRKYRAQKEQIQAFLPACRG